MDIYEIRRLQLQRLIDERFAGKTARLARALDMHPPQIHRWRSTTAKGACRMEWESARAIETKLELPDQWMDQSASGGPARRFSEGEMELAVRLVREAEREIGRCFPHTEFWRLVKAVAEMASEADRAFSSDDEDQFRKMLVKLFTTAENGESHV